MLVGRFYSGYVASCGKFSWKLVKRSERLNSVGLRYLESRRPVIMVTGVSKTRNRYRNYYGKTIQTIYIEQISEQHYSDFDKHGIGSKRYGWTLISPTQVDKIQSITMRRGDTRYLHLWPITADGSTNASLLNKFIVQGIYCWAVSRSRAVPGLQGWSHVSTLESTGHLARGLNPQQLA